ncbi:rCG27087 [Rattus norvegicus]|uniref:RCG27087 n=1 Tax=Rattus norvegicus TaxID=10116 RepID=A6HPC3_RAT|nr:rCG27087 [Rattus norvegicus]
MVQDTVLGEITLQDLVAHPIAIVQDTVLGEITLQDLVAHPMAMVQDTVLGDNITLQDLVAHPMAMAQGTVGLTLVHITEKSEEMKTQDEKSAWNLLSWHWA